jgi:nucleotide-binding universal stress UspA family protein
MLAMKNILVATDFSETSDAALRYGRALARQFGANLHVFHAVEAVVADGFTLGGYVAAVPQLQADLEASARQQLDALVTEEDRRELHARPVLSTMDAPAHAIVEYARNERIDLIVIGTHGRRGVSHLVMGSVAEKVVRTAPCPVLTVRQTEREFVTEGSDLVIHHPVNHG